MVGAVAKECVENSFAFRLTLGVLGGFGGYENGIDLGEHARIIKAQNPPAGGGVFAAENSQISHGALISKRSTPDVEG